MDVAEHSKRHNLSIYSARRQRGVRRCLIPDDWRWTRAKKRWSDSFAATLGDLAEGGSCRRQTDSILFGEHLRARLSVRIEPLLFAHRPGFSLLSAADVPIRTAALQHVPQVVTQFFHRRPAEKPVAVVDLVDAQPRL